MEFGVLGPLVVVDDAGRSVAVAGRLRALLAVLLVRPNRVVPVEELAEIVWDGAPPGGAVRTVRSYLVRLRHAVGPSVAARIETRDPGYLCRVGGDELDSLRFEASCRSAGVALRAGEWAAAVAAAAAALALWRDEPLLDVPSRLLRERVVPRFAELRVQAEEDRAEAELRLGRYDRVVPRLRELAAAHPLRERFHAQLMLALARSGRQAEALDAYREARRVLVEELGIEPGPELRQLQERVLAGEVAGAAAVDAGAPVPRQLPAGVRYFTGRRPELAVLLGLLDTPSPVAGTVVISAIDGMAGVGKTALAVHAAHQLAGRFPDGQLYANLRGFDPAGSPLPAGTAVRRFLDALAVPPARVPADPDAQVDLYRSLLAGRRVLIVLDNARDAGQVRPLLPGAAGCLVLVTSRNRLDDLVALDGAVPLTVGLLTGDEARELLARRLGPARTGHQHIAVARMVALCDRLPLALNLVAGRAATRGDEPLSALAAELDDVHRRLDRLSTGAGGADLRAVFSWSYRAVSAPAARLFRLLAAHPGPDIGRPAAADLAGGGREQAHRALDELTAANLLTEQHPGRYGLHDLLHAYATEQALHHDGAAGWRAAAHRVLEHHLHTADAAARLLRPGRTPIELGPPAPGVTPEEFADRDQAFGWHLTEHATLPPLVALAVDAGFDRHAWQLVWEWAGFLDLRGYWRELAALTEVALAAATRGGDRFGQATSHRLRGDALTTLGSYDEAGAHLEQAIQLFDELHDDARQAGAHHVLAVLLGTRERFIEARQHAQLALKLHGTAGNRTGQAWSLNAIGWYSAMLGHHEQALSYGRQALELAGTIDAPELAAATLDTVAYAHQHLGHHDTAIRYYRRVIELRRSVGDTLYEAKALLALGDTHQAAADTAAARDAWQQALTLLDALHHPDADEARTRLHDPPGDS